MNKIFEEVIRNIPNYEEFLTVDEMDANSHKLAEEYPDVVDIFEIGRTRENHPLYCLKIGEGSKNALMFGLPHPNEPIGAMMLEYFSRELASNEQLRSELDYTWYIIKAWDADGTKLNEGWFKGPFTLYNYARNFFRPAGHQQVDWTFPIEYKQLKFNNSIPETIAMKELIDKIKPEFIYSLHNAGFGGAYWYITHEVSELYDELRESAVTHGVPLSLGEPEAPFCEAYSPAIYQSLGIRQNYDYLEKYGVKNPAEHLNVGTCSADYAMEKYESFTLLTELPYFYDERIKDLSESAISRKEAILGSVEFSEESDKFIVQTIEEIKQYTNQNNPFRLALEAFTDNKESNAATREMVLTDPKYSKKATVAEEFDNLLVSKFYKMLSYGLLVRLSETELTKLKESPEENEERRTVLEKAFQNSLSQLKALSDKLEKEINYQVVPIQKLVAIQLECGLLLADHLQKNIVAK
ncbi:M14 family zinc carboxypeptidase [Sporosarcina sp. ITBMC105]